MPPLSAGTLLLRVSGALVPGAAAGGRFAGSAREGVPVHPHSLLGFPGVRVGRGGECAAIQGEAEGQRGSRELGISLR